MSINDLIFKELLKRGYTLEGKTRVWDLSDSKLWYLTPSQAQGYLDLAKTKGYKKEIIEKEVSLIKKHIDKFIDWIPKEHFNILDLGCGNGYKASLIIEEFTKKRKIRYIPIDISSYMVKKAAQTIKKMKLGKVLRFKWNVSDFENLNNVTPLYRTEKFKNHFMLLLGNTLGNFDRDNILHGIKIGMNKNDVLLIGNGLSIKDEEKITSPYKDRLVHKFLIKILNHLNIKETEVNYDVRMMGSKIEMFYILKKNKKLKHLGKTVKFKKGDKIITGISYKYTQKDFRKMLKRFFSKVKICTDKDNSYALALCKK